MWFEGFVIQRKMFRFISHMKYRQIFDAKLSMLSLTEV